VNAAITGVNFDWKTLGISLAMTAFALLAKLVFDSFDYYFTVVEV